jgi:hypothetical protein
MTFKAYYLPYTEKENPSKGGFETVEEAVNYIDTQVCEDCLKGLYDSPCYAEWIVDKEED